jgi:peptidoglycan DL-endopeptidase CwlO
MSPSSAQPDIKDVKVKVDRLYEKAEHAQERLNDARVKLSDVTKDLDALRQDQDRQQARLEVARRQVADSVVAQYQGQGLSVVGEVAVSEDPSAFLEQLTTMSEFNDIQSYVFGDYATELKALNIRKDETQRRQEQASALKKELAAHKTEVDKNFNQATRVLNSLEAEQRREVTQTEVSRGEAPPRLPDVKASGQASAVVNYALSKVGGSYVYGAAGPSSFDCSGLTMMAWAQAGVSLPHSSSAQMGSGPQVSSSDLQPGDLVFYYSPVSHVGIYIGDGKMVDAANPSDGIRIADVFSMPFSGAVRPG